MLRSRLEPGDGPQSPFVELGDSEAAVNELAGLLRQWGVSVDDLTTLDIDSKTIVEVQSAFEGWEAHRATSLHGRSHNDCG